MERFRNKGLLISVLALGTVAILCVLLIGVIALWPKTRTVVVTATPENVEVTRAEESPLRSDSLPPTNTPRPTDTPAPTNTAAPTDTPLPTDTPTPTAAEAVGSQEYLVSLVSILSEDITPPLQSMSDLFLMAGDQLELIASPDWNEQVVEQALLLTGGCSKVNGIIPPNDAMWAVNHRIHLACDLFDEAMTSVMTYVALPLEDKLSDDALSLIESASEKMDLARLIIENTAELVP